MQTVALEIVPTPAGEYRALWLGGALVFGVVGPGAARHVAAFVKRQGLALGGAPGATLAPGLRAYFRGETHAFRGVQTRMLGGTEFQRAVWAALAGIAYGKLETYGALAAKIGRPGSGRPVGQAVGANPLTIVLPCHRVVGASGALTGFGCGLPVKRILLAVEGWSIPGTDRLPV
jgi:methylated-DNA-[protein]-cysteine S-methyltransferase